MTRRHFWAVRVPRDPFQDLRTAMRLEADRLGCEPSEVFAALRAERLAARDGHEVVAEAEALLEEA